MLVVFFTAFCRCITTSLASTIDHRIVGMFQSDLQDRDCGQFGHFSTDQGSAILNVDPRQIFFFFYVLRAIQSLYNQSGSCVCTLSTKSNTFSVGIGLSQGCALSPIWFVNNWQESGTWEWTGVLCGVNGTLDRRGKEGAARRSFLFTSRCMYWRSTVVVSCR